MSALTLGLYTYGLAMVIVELVGQGAEYTSKVSIITTDWWFWTMIGLNVFNVGASISKIILVFVEVNMEDPEALSWFKMHEKVGTMNLD